MAFESVFLQCLSLFVTIVAPVNAISFKCDQRICVITELRTPQETFVYRYIPENVARVTYVRLMVRHVDANILEGIGAGRAKHVSIGFSPQMQRLSLSSKCNIYFLDLQSTGLREIEFEENHKLKVLKIIGSSLASVTPTIRFLKNLRKLKISRSPIQRLDLTIFCWQKNMSIVDFSMNRIRSITSNNAESCTTPIKSIYLSHNVIASLDLQVFDAFFNLYEMHLDYNQIVALFGQFTSKTIRFLKLENNRLQTLHMCDWDTPNLEELLLHDNLLASLPQCLGNLKNLTNLSLNTNHITSVAIESFATMWSLTRLSISNNNMTSVILNSTHFPPQLKRLELNSNLLTNLNLSSIPVENFEISVVYNLITSFDVNGTSSNVTKLRMDCNPIDCTWYTEQQKKSAVCERDHEVVHLTSNSFETEILRYSFVKRNCNLESYRITSNTQEQERNRESITSVRPYVNF